MKQTRLLILIISCYLPETAQQQIGNALISKSNSYYAGNKQPLRPSPFIKLPVSCFKPKGWLLKFLQLQRDGLTGNLGKISAWLAKTDNAWLTKDGKGKWGWEELPYWLKGYAHIGYLLQDQNMIDESNWWINAVLSNQRPDGDFGPVVLRNGKRDLWTNMPMLWVLQSYYEYSNDARVLTFLTNYFKWEMALPDDQFLEDYWENSRGGDNMYSVYWLYNRTGEPWLLELATKIDRNTANWRQKDNLPNWHNVNIVQCFREPATYYMQSNNAADLEATYNDYRLVRAIYGQVPGGLFGADENARAGYDDPRQAVETCGMVEQMTSDQLLLQFTGDAMWADNCEDVAFNMFPAAFMPDYRSLRYLTAPNMVVSDSMNHAPGIANEGPFLMMNPFSSRCCQHNHSAGWAYYAANSWMATPDNGLAAQLYVEGDVTAKVGDGREVTLSTKTHYPFEEGIEITVTTPRTTAFPVYLRIPGWCAKANITVNGRPVTIKTAAGTYVQLSRQWANGDKIKLQLPMQLQLRQWTRNKNSVSINYGPLTFSLLIKEEYKKQDSKATAIYDSRWQENADVTAWPSYEIFPASPWNYGLQVNPQQLGKSFSIKKKAWPKDDNPFTNATAPIELIATGKQIPGWTIDQYGLCAVIPPSPVAASGPAVPLTLVPMGGARLRISSFPVVK